MKNKKADQLFKKFEKKHTKSIAEKKKREERENKKEKEYAVFVTDLQKMIVELLRPEMKEVLQQFSKMGFKTKINKYALTIEGRLNDIVEESYEIYHPSTPKKILDIWLETYEYIPKFCFGYGFDDHENNVSIYKSKHYTLKEFDAGIIQKVFKKGIKKFLKNS